MLIKDDVAHNVGEQYYSCWLLLFTQGPLDAPLPNTECRPGDPKCQVSFKCDNHDHDDDDDDHDGGGSGDGDEYIDVDKMDDVDIDSLNCDIAPYWWYAGLSRSDFTFGKTNPIQYKFDIMEEYKQQC